MSKKTWGVTVPFTGTAYIEVVAETEEEAIDAALDGVTSDQIESWEATRKIVRGNVFYGMQNEAEAQDLGEADE